MARKRFRRVIIAAYRLPFRFVKNKGRYKAVQNSGGLVSAMLTLFENFADSENMLSTNKIIWTGVADPNMNTISPEKIENDFFDIRPVFLSDNINNLFYGGFCNDLIWPLFHYFPSYCVFNNDYFDAYREANLKFCEQIIKMAEPGDFIWIHDYQLMLLPEMIHNLKPDVSIGFFLHIPFPSFEIYRLLPRLWRESLLKGILGADLIGFHTNDYTQHFIKSVKRTLGYECRQNLIYTPNRVVKADAFPIGIDFEKFNSSSNARYVLAEKEKIKKSLIKQKLIFSVDRLDYSKGLLNRLRGYESFLEKYPQWHSKVVFNMVVVPSRDSIEKYREMKKEIESTVGRINGKFSSLSWRPVIYQYKSLSFNEMVALYDLSDVGLITPLRDGMNLVAKEFVACQNENQGVLILSEMAGAAAELNEALIVNPADNIEMADAIFNALEMSVKEKKERIARMKNRIKEYNVFTWAHDFFDRVNEIKEQQKEMNVRIVNKEISSKILSDYKNSERCIFFLDYDGTLVSFEKFPELAVINENTLAIIRRLSEKNSNIVVIISGRDKYFLEKQFEGVSVDLVAEHGYFIKKSGGDWKTTDDSDMKWKDQILSILLEYVKRCNGTFLEEKAGCIAWHYRNADTDFAQLRLNELRDDLRDMIQHNPDIEIIEGHKVLEIKSRKFNKGLAAQSFIKENHFNYIFAAGDDKTDESLFSSLPSHAYTFRIGLTPSMAKYNISDQPSFIKLLKSMSEL